MPLVTIKGFVSWFYTLGLTFIDPGSPYNFYLLKYLSMAITLYWNVLVKTVCEKEKTLNKELKHMQQRKKYGQFILIQIVHFLSSYPLINILGAVIVYLFTNCFSLHHPINPIPGGWVVCRLQVLQMSDLVQSLSDLQYSGVSVLYG